MASAGFFPSTMSPAGQRGARGATAVHDAGAGTREVDLRPSSVNGEAGHSGGSASTGRGLA